MDEFHSKPIRYGNRGHSRDTKGNLDPLIRNDGVGGSNPSCGTNKIKSLG